ncbi:MAG: hypothetical protein Q4A28_06910 [Brachymonas sp.]|nr:hypothetical protein [Brachymonas sp.]
MFFDGRGANQANKQWRQGADAIQPRTILAGLGTSSQAPLEQLRIFDGLARFKVKQAVCKQAAAIMQPPSAHLPQQHRFTLFSEAVQSPNTKRLKMDAIGL